MESTLTCPNQEKLAVLRVRNVMGINSVSWDPNRPGIFGGDILVGEVVGLDQFGLWNLGFADL